MTYYIIYQTTNKINGKIYVGKHKTSNLDDGYLGSGKHLNNAIAKYGVENFERTILFFCESEDEMNAKEAEIVNEEFVAREDTYNLKIGGDGGWDFVNDASKSGYTADKKSKLLKNAYKTNSELRKIISVSVQNYLKNESEEHRKNRLEKTKATLKELFRTGQLTSSFKGKKHSEATKEKIGIKNRENHFKEKNGNFNHHWWKDPNDKTKSLSIKEGDPVPEGWIRGKWQLQSENTRCIINNETGKCKYIDKNLPMPGGLAYF